MARIVKKDEPIEFMCDQAIQCEGISVQTPEHGFMEAYYFMQRQGWKAFKADDGVWQHSCPFCYVDWCRRANVDPYATSEWTTYDETLAHVLATDPSNELLTDDALEPQWYLDKLKAAREKEARKRRTLADQLASTKRERNKRRKARKKHRQPDHAIEHGAGYEDDFVSQDAPGSSGYDRYSPIRFPSGRYD